MYMYNVTAVYSKIYTMNIIGITETEEVGDVVSSRITEQFRTGHLKNFIDSLKLFKPNVFLNEELFRFDNITKEREEIFIDKLLNFMKKVGTFEVLSRSCVPVEVYK